MHRLLWPYSLLAVCRFTRADEDPHMASVASLLVDHAKAHARKAAIEIGQYLLHDGSFSADGRGAAGVLAQGTVHVYGAGHATPQCSVAPIANISARRAAGGGAAGPRWRRCASTRSANAPLRVPTLSVTAAMRSNIAARARRCQTCRRCFQLANSTGITSNTSGICTIRPEMIAIASGCCIDAP